MGYTHGYTLEDEFRICTKCGRKLPNTEEYFRWQIKNVQLQAQCKECRSKIAKEKNKILKESKPKTNRPEYDFEKECIKCHRLLPYNWMYFPTDKTTKSGLRNKCRECTPNYSKFLNEESKIAIKWTDEEISLLKEVYHDYTGKELKEKFFQNRTVRAIESEASILGINGKTDETNKRARQVAGKITSQKLSGIPKSKEQVKQHTEFMINYYKTHTPYWLGKKRSEEQRELISKRMKGKWSGDKNPRHINPLTGVNNGRWKGGLTNLYFELRSEITLWKKESMNFCNYKCIITNSDFKEIHHLYPFRDIVDEAFNITKLPIYEKVGYYDYNDFLRLRETVIVLHQKYGLGACLNDSVHKLFHDNYGYTDFTLNDFIEFINDIFQGKYNTWFNDNNLDININWYYYNYLMELKGNEVVI